jgi:hypothetical protein
MYINKNKLNTKINNNSKLSAINKDIFFKEKFIKQESGSDGSLRPAALSGREDLV